MKRPALPLTRRRFLTGLSLSLATFGLRRNTLRAEAGRIDHRQSSTNVVDQPLRIAARLAPWHRQGRLRATLPGGNTPKLGRSGVYKLALTGGVTNGRPTMLYVPARYDEGARPMPLWLFLHGAGSTPYDGMRALRTQADSFDIMLLSPASCGASWDIVSGQYGVDVACIDAALEQLFLRYAIDSRHLAIGGLSDGASYALSLGLRNGVLFTHVIAFSPGFMTPASRIGSPRLFVSHGLQDSVLPIDTCSRRLVPSLRQAGYDVTYREFDGPHGVPQEVRQEATQWFLDKAPSAGA